MARFPQNDIMSLTGSAARYDLAESYGPNLTLGQLLDAAGSPDLEALPLAYGTAAGDGELRRAIAELHGAAADEVVTTVGGAHALFLLAFILCGPGDEAVTTTPVFPHGRNALDAVGATVRALPARFEEGYRIEADAVAALLGPRTALVSLASPQNPSGVAVPPATLRAILARMAEICPKAHLLVDETYREATYGDDPAVPSAVALDPHVVAVASLSKAHGAPGLRLGWAVTRDKALREQLIVAKFNTVICHSPLDETLGRLLIGRREAVLAARRTHLAQGLARCAAWIEAQAAFVDWVRPDAGALCCIRLKPGRFDAARRARFLDALAASGVRLADGTWFGDEPGVFRLGFGLLTLPDLDTALAGLATALARAAG